jgi:hypothetical protein
MLSSERNVGFHRGKSNITFSCHTVGVCSWPQQMASGTYQRNAEPQDIFLDRAIRFHTRAYRSTGVLHNLSEPRID